MNPDMSRQILSRGDGMPVGRRTPAIRQWAATGAAALLLILSDPVQALDCDDARTGLSPVLYSPTEARDARALAVVSDLLARVRDRSRALGGARLLADAEQASARAVAAGSLPRANLSAGAARAGLRVPGQPTVAENETSVAVDLGAPLYDGGRLAALSEAQRQQAEAARLDARSLARELERLTVAAALERSRYYKQDQVLTQHVARMRCLADAVRATVAADPGRASELVQARKALSQLELARTRARAAKDDAELRLRRLVGEPLPRLEGLTTILRELPPQALMENGVIDGAELAQLRARVRAERARTRALRAEGGPRVDWQLRTARTTGFEDETEWRAGVQFHLPLFDGSRRHAVDAGVLREQALQWRLEDAMDERLADLDQTRARAVAALARMDDVDGILADSDRLRRATIEQWRALGRRSLFDVMSAEQDHYGLRIAQVDALHDAQRSVARLWAIGPGLTAWLEGRDEAAPEPGEGPPPDKDSRP